MRIKLKNPIAQLENPKKSLMSRMNQAENSTSGLNDKSEDLNHITKRYEHFKQKRNIQEILGLPEMMKSLNCGLM